MNASLQWAAAKMKPKINAAREEGKRDGRAEAIGELESIAQLYDSGSLARSVVKACVYSLREKASKLP